MPKVPYDLQHAPPQPCWDADHEHIPYCDTKCRWYENSDPDTFEGCTAFEHLSGMPEMCWECAICLPALAIGRTNCEGSK